MKRAEWRRKARARQAVVPDYFEVTPTTVVIVCGKCKTRYSRNLVPYVNEPTIVCPNDTCRVKNWLPVRYKMRY